MPRTWVRPVTQIRNSDTYDDTLAAGATLESAATDGEYDLNAIRSQLNRILKADGSLGWTIDVPTINTKKRGLWDLNTDLDDIEEKKLLARVNILTDISVPAGVVATGTITTLPVANLVDTETFTLDDGVNTPTVFEFDVAGDGVGGGNTSVDVSALTTADEVRDAIITAITGVGATLAISATNGGAATVNLVNDVQGTAGNTASSDTVTDAGFVVTDMTGGAGDVVILSVAGSETPSLNIAIATTVLGAVSAQSALSGAGFGVVELTEIASSLGDSTNPRNLLIIRDASNGQIIQSEGRDVFGLLQVESSATDDAAFNDTSGGNRGKISFVRLNSTFDDLEVCPGNAIAGKDINYAYVRRISLDTIPEDSFLMTGSFVDQVAAVDVTLDQAIDNQVGNATQVQNIVWDVGDTYTLSFTSDSGATNILQLAPTGAGDTVTLNATDLDVNLSNDADFSQGLKADTGGTEIDIGVTAGYVESTGANDLGVRGAGELYLDDGNQTGSSWTQTGGIKLSEDTTEWDNFDTAFGEVSLLNAILQAYSSTARTKTVASVTAPTIAANVNVTGAGGTPNISAQLGDYSGATFLTDVDVFLNGVLMWNGADAAANNDVYPGDSAANGDLKFEFNLKINDVITMIVN